MNPPQPPPAPRARPSPSGLERRLRRRDLLRGGLAALVLGLAACRPAGSGLAFNEQFEAELDKLLHRTRAGDDVVLTIDAAFQRRAVELLGDAAGSVVAIEPRTGDVLALASTPVFDPNAIVYNPNAPSDPAELERIQQAWSALVKDARSPLLNRATGGLYVPGSTFKTVTLAAALDRGAVKPSDVFRFTLKPPNAQHRVAWHDNPWTTCQNHPTLSQFDLAGAYAWSCNVVFAEIGLKLGPAVLTEYAHRFGLEEVIPFDLPVEPSRLTTDPNYFASAEGTYGLASTAFGQGQLQVTPLQMALVAATIANGGQTMRPRLVLEQRRPDGAVAGRNAPERWRQPVSGQTAATVAQMMVGGVENGWASAVKIPGLPLGGKTGTAELESGAIPHSWFIGFGPAGAPRLALAVVVENAGFGSDRAAPIARQLFQAALR